MPHDTPESSHLPTRPLHLEFDFLDYVQCYLYPGWPGGAAGCKVRGQPVGAGLSKQREEQMAGVEPTTARVWPKLVSCKSLSECCEARAGAESGLVVGWWLGLENSKRSRTAQVVPTVARVLPKLVPSKSLSECCEGPK